MHLAHLSLVNFRNYTRLELPLTPGITLLVGDNAQGKSNLLEAIYFLATTKSFRSASDRDLINWLASNDGTFFTRVAARLHREQVVVRLEVLVREVSRADGGFASSKQARINGIARRAIDFIGQANVVLFSPQDIDLITGGPHLRRRYLDVTISQVDSRYVRALAHYNKVLTQRNHLLRQIKERQSTADQLFFWDRELAEAGAYVTLQRKATIEQLQDLVREQHRELTERGEHLRLEYRSTTGSDEAVGGLDRVDDLVSPAAEGFRRLLSQNQAREVAYGVSLFGPHRDDVVLTINDRDAAACGSRGQQRTVVLSLKLAEASLMRQRSGEDPIVLLDDILSELDRKRGHRVLTAISSLPQVLVTASDLDAFEGDLLARAASLRVDQGLITASLQPSTPTVN